jgi:serine/threonine protein kinase
VNNYLPHLLILNQKSLFIGKEKLFSKKIESDLFRSDIAARNVLVSNHESVKLADFGLSRQLTVDNSYYKGNSTDKKEIFIFVCSIKREITDKMDGT